MMDNTTRPIKPRTIITRFKNDENIRLEEIGEEYGMDGEKFLETLHKIMNNAEFKKLLKANDKREGKSAIKPVCVLAKPREALEDLLSSENFVDVQNELVDEKTSNTAENMEEELVNKATSTPTENMEDEMVTGTKEEGTMKKAENSNTLEELTERKDILETRISSEESKKEYKLILVQTAEQERDETQKRIEDLNEQITSLNTMLKTAEEDLFSKECELEKLQLDIKSIEDKANEYKKELTSVETAIAKASMVFLMTPSYRGHPKKDGSIYVSSTPGKGDGVKLDTYGEDKVDEMTRKELKALAAENNYTDVEKFALDYGFVLLVQKYHNEGTKYCVKTSETSKVNELLDKLIGKGEWNHD